MFGNCRTFEQFVHYCDDKLEYIPINFMLGFFVTSVLNRWINFFNNIGYIDNIGLMVAAYVRGTDEKTRMQRRNIVRYCVLSQALVFRDISMRVRKRFPTVDALVAAGFMMEHEKELFDQIQYRYAKYWMPFQWALALCQEARTQQKIASDIILQKVGEEIKLFRTNMAILCNFDWVPLPIMYPQLIVLAVHTYFLICLLSRQFIISDDAANKSLMDLFLPVMTVLQFTFYMGWLKVAEAMLNPFGEDDDDFECNFLLDKNLTIGLTIVDAGYGKTPAVMKDIFWNDKIEPLYTLESVRDEHTMSGITGSAANIKLHENDRQMKMMPLPHEEKEGHNSAHPFGLFRRSFQKRFGMRSMSHTAEHYAASMDTAADDHRKHSSDLNLHAMERGSRDRRCSLSSAMEAIVNESGACTNVAVVVGGSSVYNCFWTRSQSISVRYLVSSTEDDVHSRDGDESPEITKEGPFVFPSHNEFHATSNDVAHRLEDVIEESEENASKMNTVEKPEDRTRPSIMVISNRMRQMQARDREGDKSRTESNGESNLTTGQL
ncbi:unnamed protein product [Anisakis simplex]|uniref:Bestrophin homolog n=1 Tax=Anisakis simplex TaxID=6269 RepID=A0A3P6RDA9_ANISI|nr:unnamed protein product [Anisakis simplex]